MEDFSTIETQKIYDISFIQRSENVGVVRQIIEKYGGVILNEHPLVKLRLSYPIKKETQGFLGTIECTLPAESVRTVSSDVKLEHDILRFIVNVQNKIKEAAPRSSEEGGLQQRKKRTIVPPKPKGGFNTILSNEALQEKLEEILQ